MVKTYGLQGGVNACRSHWMASVRVKRHKKLPHIMNTFRLIGTNDFAECMASTAERLGRLRIRLHHGFVLLAYTVHFLALNMRYHWVIFEPFRYKWNSRKYKNPAPVSTFFSIKASKLAERVTNIIPWAGKAIHVTLGHDEWMKRRTSRFTLLLPRQVLLVLTILMKIENRREIALKNKEDSPVFPRSVSRIFGHKNCGKCVPYPHSFLQSIGAHTSSVYHNREG